MNNLSAWIGIRQVNWQWRGHVTIYRNGSPYATMLCDTLWDKRDEALDDAYFVMKVNFEVTRWKA
jgi:hypothetical protein